MFVDLENKTPKRLSLLKQRSDSNISEELDDSESDNILVDQFFDEPQADKQEPEKSSMLLEEDYNTPQKEEEVVLKGIEESDLKSNEDKEKKKQINKKITKRSKGSKNPFENRASIFKRSKNRKTRWSEEKDRNVKDYLNFSPGNNFFLSGEPAKRSYIKKHAFMNYSELLSEIPKLSKFNWFETKLSSCKIEL